MNEVISKEQIILDVSLKLFVRNGFHGTPTSLIAQEAGISNGTLFHYFPTKDDLINRLYLHIKEDMVNRTIIGLEDHNSTKLKLEKIWYNLIKWAYTHPDKHYFIQQFTFSPFLNQVTRDLVEEQKRIFQNLILKGKDEKIIKDLPTDLIYIITNSTLNGYLQYMEKAGLVFSEANVKHGFDLLWDSIKS
jgi:AcrR family transcriptional regulator